MFERAIVFGDIHFGKKGNSQTFNQDCVDYISWLCEKAKELKAETCIFLGDWHHDRKYVHTRTLKESIYAMKQLSDTFDVIIVLLGNHDLYYRDKRDVHSVEFMKDYENVCIIEEPVVVEDCCFFPWITASEKHIVREWNVTYAFGHFEISKFLMNSMVEYEDEHALCDDDFKNYEFVFSGHFHKRQNRNNIWYVGSPFPHDYSDINDNERGFCFVEKGKEPVFYNWPDQPSYIQIDLSELLEAKNIEEILRPKTYAKLVLDVDISFEETIKLKEYFIEDLQCREVRFIPKEIEFVELENADELEKNFKTVDELVIESLKTIDSPTINTDLLIKIYRDLEKKE